MAHLTPKRQYRPPRDTTVGPSSRTASAVMSDRPPGLTRGGEIGPGPAREFGAAATGTAAVRKECFTGPVLCRSPRRRSGRNVRDRWPLARLIKQSRRGDRQNQFIPNRADPPLVASAGNQYLLACRNMNETFRGWLVTERRVLLSYC